MRSKAIWMLAKQIKIRQQLLTLLYKETQEWLRRKLPMGAPSWPSLWSQRNLLLLWATCHPNLPQLGYQKQSSAAKRNIFHSIFVEKGVEHFVARVTTVQKSSLHWFIHCLWFFATSAFKKFENWNMHSHWWFQHLFQSENAESIQLESHWCGHVTCNQRCHKNRKIHFMDWDHKPFQTQRRSKQVQRFQGCPEATVLGKNFTIFKLIYWQWHQR